MDARLTLAETCLSNIPSHMLSFFRFPKGVGKRLDFFRARLVWQEKDVVRKYHLVNWADVCRPRDRSPRRRPPARWPCVPRAHYRRARHNSWL